MLKRVDLKIGAETTPKELASIFTASYMREQLRIFPADSACTAYKARMHGSGYRKVKPTQVLVYLGMGGWKVNESKIKIR